ncbi:MAG: helix-turn-helix domain-containing protein [Bacteroidota bacterium]
MAHHLLFFFSALGVFNALLAGLYLVAARWTHAADRLLGLLLLAVCVRVGVSCAYFFAETMPWTAVQVGLSAHLLMGALLLEYVRAEAGAPQARTIRRWHLGGVVLALCSFGVLFPFEQHPRVWDYHLRYTLHAVVAGYILATGWRLWQARQGRHARGVQVFAVMVAVALGFVVSLYTSYVLGPVIFSFIVYAVSGALLWRRRQTPHAERPAYAEKKIAEAEATPIIDRLRHRMQADALFRQPDLKLAGLAKAVGTTPHHLSQILNDNLGARFSTFVNGYRVAEAERLLRECPDLTIEAIGYEAGFSSKSAFYAAFKKHHGVPPAQYQRQVRAPDL